MVFDCYPLVRYDSIQLALPLPRSTPYNVQVMLWFSDVQVTAS